VAVDPLEHVPDSLGPKTLFRGPEGAGAPPPCPDGSGRAAGLEGGPHGGGAGVSQPPLGGREIPCAGDNGPGDGIRFLPVEPGPGRVRIKEGAGRYVQRHGHPEDSAQGNIPASALYLGHCRLGQPGPGRERGLGQSLGPPPAAQSRTNQVAH